MMPAPASTVLLIQPRGFLELPAGASPPAPSVPASDAPLQEAAGSPPPLQWSVKRIEIAAHGVTVLQSGPRSLPQVVKAHSSLLKLYNCSKL